MPGGAGGTGSAGTTNGEEHAHEPRGWHEADLRRPSPKNATALSAGYSSTAKQAGQGQGQLCDLGDFGHRSTTNIVAPWAQPSGRPIYGHWSKSEERRKRTKSARGLGRTSVGDHCMLECEQICNNSFQSHKRTARPGCGRSKAKAAYQGADGNGLDELAEIAAWPNVVLATPRAPWQQSRVTALPLDARPPPSELLGKAAFVALAFASKQPTWLLFAAALGTAVGQPSEDSDFAGRDRSPRGSGSASTRELQSRETPQRPNPGSAANRPGRSQAAQEAIDLEDAVLEDDMTHVQLAARMVELRAVHEVRMRRIADRIVGLRQLADEELPWPEVHIVPLAQQAQREPAQPRSASCSSHDYRTTRHFRRQAAANIPGRVEPSLGESGSTSSLQSRYFGQNAGAGQAASSSREPRPGPAPAAAAEVPVRREHGTHRIGTRDTVLPDNRAAAETPASTPRSSSSSSSTALLQSRARLSAYYYYYEEGYIGAASGPPCQTWSVPAPTHARRRRPQPDSTARGSSSSGAGDLSSESGRTGA
jgi:hypothetical protein